MEDGTSENTCKFDLNELIRRLLDRGLSEINVGYLVADYPKDWRCNRDVYKDGYCIFHSPEKPDDFEDRFWDELRRAERNSDVIDFSGAIFPQMVFLSLERRLEVSKPAIFLGAEFRGFADFTLADFQEGANFTGSIFQKGVNFTNAVFRGDADFTGSKFKGIANFMSSKFQREVNFTLAEFQKGANFALSEFERGGNFWFSEFQGHVNFNFARFHQGADFAHSEFQGEADFTGSKFQGGVSFSSAVFQSRADFSLLLEGIADFGHSTFNSFLDLRIDPIDRGKDFILLFHAVDLRELRRVTLTGFPLSSASFLKTDLTGVTLVPSKGPSQILDDKLLDYKRRDMERENHVENNSEIGKAYSREMFRNTAWIRFALSSLSRKNLPRLTKLENGAYKLLKNSLTEGLVLAEYKSIRKCLEENKMFTEAAGLFISEMRLARERLGWRRPGEFLEKLAHYFYDEVARYGESLERSLGFYVLAILIASIALGWTLSGHPDLISSLSWILNNPGAAVGLFGEYVWKVMAVSVQIRAFKDFFDMNVASSTSLLMIEIPLRVLSLIFLGSFFVALKRRLERK